MRGGPHAGDRLPDVRLTIGGRATCLHEAIVGPHLTLLLCGDPAAWDAARVAELRAYDPDLLRVQHLARQAQSGVLLDSTGEAFARLGVRRSAQYLIRPDGHVAFRCRGNDLSSVAAYLADWFPRFPGAT